MCGNIFNLFFYLNLTEYKILIQYKILVVVLIRQKRNDKSVKQFHVKNIDEDYNVLNWLIVEDTSFKIEKMGGMPGPMKDEKGRPTRKAMSLRRWRCG